MTKPLISATSFSFGRFRSEMESSRNRQRPSDLI
jgi:hypothetical protein